VSVKQVSVVTEMRTLLRNLENQLTWLVELKHHETNLVDCCRFDVCQRLLFCLVALEVRQLCQNGKLYNSVAWVVVFSRNAR
jgi:hypothetical protein